MAASKNSFGARDTLKVGSQNYEFYRLEALERRGIGHVGQVPFSIRILLENLLRQEDGRFVKPKDIEALAEWQPVADKRGVMSWTFDLAPGESKDIRLAYRMKWPAEREVVIESLGK